VSVQEWKEAVEHAECLARSAERKMSAQRAHFMRRLQTITMESDRLRGIVLEAEQLVKTMAVENRKVRVLVGLWVRVRC
jgi:hypothetical protein